VISEATAPAFVLGAVAGFVSILLGRLTSILERIRNLNDIGDDERSRAHLKSDLPRLRRREGLLINATRLALASGVCTSLLLAVAFGSAFMRLEHAYGAGAFSSWRLPCWVHRSSGLARRWEWGSARLLTIGEP